MCLVDGHHGCAPDKRFIRMCSKIMSNFRTSAVKQRAVDTGSENVESQYSANYTSHAIVDLAVTTGSLYLATKLRLFEALPFIPLEVFHVPLWLYPFVCLLWLTVFSYQGVYEKQTPVVASTRMLSVLKSALISALLLAGLMYLSYRGLSRGYFILFIVLNVPLLLGWRLIYKFIQQQLGEGIFLTGADNARRRVLVVGLNNSGVETYNQLVSSEYDSLDVIGIAGDEEVANETENQLPIMGRLSDVRSLVVENNINDVIIALPINEFEKTVTVVSALEDVPVITRVIPDYFAIAMFKARAETFAGVPVMNLRAPALSAVQRLYKRLFDLFVSLFLTVVLAPVFVVTALLVKLDSKGPVFFFQDRIGENGSIFKMVKFRSMVANAESMQGDVNELDIHGKFVHKKRNDRRVTRVGKFIRATSVDELPQLLNVIKGEMSLVGPRPEMPWLVKEYDRTQRKRFAVPQGITGWWQINGRSDNPMHLNTDDDLHYVNNYSFWLDLFILFKTPKVVLTGKGAF